jgi:hypothetical protein
VAIVNVNLPGVERVVAWRYNGVSVFGEPVRALLVDGVGTLELESTVGQTWRWRVQEIDWNDINVRHVSVPAGDITVSYASLEDVDPGTLEPDAAPQEAWWQALEDALLGAIPDGAVTSAKLANAAVTMSKLSQEVLEAIASGGAAGSPIIVEDENGEYADTDVAAIFVGARDPGDVPEGSVWYVVGGAPDGPLAPGQLAGPGLVGYLGDEGDLIELNSGDPFTGTSLDGKASWDSGNLRINASNFTMEGYKINAPVYHGSGEDLTIRNCVINAPAGVGFFGVSQSDEDRGTLTIEDTTIYCEPGPGTSTYAFGVSGTGRLIMRRCDISGSGDGIAVCGVPGGDYEDGSIISQCYVHDLSFLDEGQHNDGIQWFNTTESNTSQDTKGLVEYTMVDEWFGPGGIAMNAALTCGKPPGDQTGPFLSIKFEGNYFKAGAFHLRIGYRTANVVVVNNNLGVVNANSNEFGLVEVADSGSIITWSGNVDGNGDPVEAPGS